ncbi:MAG: hypothetical protein JRJ76_08780 [Deltaproteobacteria bacterium]|nr:hypothetical protein [Deltaproteobacteria bacterium]MBW2364732.1 hypothetical protein [Deltaproteobacteria bacterium]
MEKKILFFRPYEETGNQLAQIISISPADFFKRLPAIENGSDTFLLTESEFVS